MAKTKNAVKKSEETAMAVPDFMQADGRAGLEDAGRHIRPPRLRVVQAQSKGLKALGFDPGDAVLTPQNIAVLPFDKTGEERIRFVCIYRYTEYVCWNPREATDLPAIRERSRDHDSALARKCRNQDQWFEVTADLEGRKDDKGNQLRVRNQEHLNFLCLLEGVDGLEDTPVLMSFSRAEHITGSNFLALAMMRKAPRT